MPQQPEPLPRIVDLSPVRRPGGARGAPLPVLSPHAPACLWLTTGDVINARAEGDDADAEPWLIPWELVDWWIPV